MCDPMTLAVVGTAVAAAGTAVSGYMAYNQHRYQARVARENRRLENARAAEALDRGAVEERTLGRRYSALAGSQRASMAANGIDIGFGSAADVLGDTAQFHAEDSAALRSNNMAEVRGIEISAANYGAQARASSMAGTSALVAAGFDTASTILGGMAKTQKMGAARAGGG